jgi:acetyl esterase/lipase
MQAAMPRRSYSYAYGPHPEQVADLHLPAIVEGPGPAPNFVEGPGPAPKVVVLIHGGFWRARYGKELMTPLAEDLAERGMAAWNVEFRRLDKDGGWPATAEDVAASIDFLRDELGHEPIAAVGHSAGGHLALLMADRVPRIVGQAAVSDLVEGSRLGLGGGVVDDFAGGALREASPIERAPLGVPVLLVHGTEDEDDTATLYERFAACGGDVTLSLREGERHMEHIDPTSGAWQEVVAWLTA